MGNYTPEDMALVQEFLTIMPMLHRYIFQHQLEECDVLISPNQMHALLTLKLFPRSNMTQLASRLMVSKQQLTKIVDVLAEKARAGKLSPSDMQGGRNAGIATCWVNPTHEPRKEGIHVDYEIEALSQLPSLLEGL